MSVLSGKNVLVLGASGFLGSHFVDYCVRAGAKVAGTYVRQKPFFANAQADYFQCDLTTSADLTPVFAGMDTVILAAAVTSGAAAIRRDPMTHVTPNVILNARALDAAYRAGVKRFVFISSSVIYPSTGEKPAKEGDWLQGEPEEVYFQSGWMKRYAEILCRTYAEKVPAPMKVLVLRPSNVFGPRDKFDFERSHFTAALIRRAAEGQDPFVIWGDGQDRRDLLYVDDFMEGSTRALELDHDYLAIHIAAGKTWKVVEIAEQLFKLTGRDPGTIQFDKSRPQTTRVKNLDLTLSDQLLGRYQSVGVHEGLARTLAWFKENRSAY